MNMGMDKHGKVVYVLEKWSYGLCENSLHFLCVEWDENKWLVFLKVIKK